MSIRKVITLYKWRINDFHEKISIVEGGGSVKSGFFFLNGNSKAKFFLKLERNEEGHSDMYLICNQFGRSQFGRKQSERNREFKLGVNIWTEDFPEYKYESNLTFRKSSDTCILNLHYMIHGVKLTIDDNFWSVCCEIAHEEPINGFEEDPLDELIAHREFTRKLFELRSNGQLDGTVTIQVGNEEFKAGKLALMAYSDVFHQMFSCENAIEAKTKILKIDDIKPETIDVLVRWIYQVEAENMEDIAMDLYHAADKYNIGLLKEKCIKLMANSLSNENLVPRLILTLKFNEEKLKRYILRFIRGNYNNLKRLVASDEWLQFSAENPEGARKFFSAIPD